MSIQNFVTRGVPLSGGGAAFSPSDVAGYSHDYDAAVLASLYQDSAKTTPVTSEGDPVGAWVEQAATGDDVLQTITAAKPTYRASVAAYNNQPALQFDGGDYLKIDTFAGGAISQPITVFAVLDTVIDGSNHMFYDGVVANFFMRTLATFGYRTNAGVNLQSVSPSTSPSIYTNVFNGGSSQFWRNGVSLASGDAGANALNGLYIGSDHFAANFLIGHMPRLIFYAGLLSTDDKNLIQNFLAARYGFSVTEFV